MSNKKTIAFVASECQPFFTSGGLGEVIGSLPKRIVKCERKSWKVNVFLPKYSKTSIDFTNELEDLGHINVQLAWRNQYCGIYHLEKDDVNYYFIDNEFYFKRENFYGYYDDAERFAFFSKAVIEVMIHLNLIPNIIHCHDWQTGMVSVYLRTHYFHDERFKDVKRIFTIHNIEYQGKYSPENNFIEDVFGIDKNDTYLLEYNYSINIMKGAIESSNIVSTVSPSYAEEIKTPQYAHGLDAEINRADKEGKLMGILNGIDTDFYNPKKDKAIYKKYNQETVELKVENKLKLQEELGLEVNKNIPMISMITRLVGHKGLEILKLAVDRLVEDNVQLVILGTGDPYYEEFYKSKEAQYPDKVRVILAFNQGLARKIYAGSDLFLMPSASEPCGLSQMISSRYGTVAMVRETGGLKDSIHEFKDGSGNGYSFSGFDPKELNKMIKRALADYQKPDWLEKVKAVMDVDFSWNASASSYIEMYKKVLNK